MMSTLPGFHIPLCSHILGKSCDLYTYSTRLRLSRQVGEDPRPIPSIITKVAQWLSAGSRLEYKDARQV